MNLRYQRGSTDLCNLALVCEFISFDEESACRALCDIADLDAELSREAVQTFRAHLAEDRRWLHALSQVDTAAVLENPGAVATLLIDGFGLDELDATDVVLRLCERAKQQKVSEYAN